MSACGQAAKQEPIVSASTELHQVDLVSAGTLVFDLASVPAYSGQPYAIVNDNKPYFTDADLTAVSFETYSDLDSLLMVTYVINIDRLLFSVLHTGKDTADVCLSDGSRT